MIVLVGFMGAGKTTVGRLIAEKVQLPFRDSDEAIEERSQRSIPEIFETDGEQAFRGIESQIVAELLTGPEAVIALGGGALADRAARDALGDHTVVFLDAPLDEIERRVSDTERPMLRRHTADKLLAERLPLYRNVATITVDTSGLSPDDVVERVLGSLDAR